MGLNGYLFGIKATLFNTIECMESGVFLVADEDYWKKAGVVNEGKRKKRLTNTNTLEENYHLLFILKKAGWRILFDALNFDNGPNKSEILGRKSLNGLSCTDQMENILHMQSVLLFYKNTDE